MVAYESSSNDGRAFRLGDWRVDPMSCRLTRDGVEVSLEPRVMELLAFLAAREGRLATKDEILDHVWSGHFVVETVLTRAVSLLRKSLGDSAREPAYIATVPRRGYRVVARVEWIEPGRPTHPLEPGALRWTLRKDDGQVVLSDGETVIGRGVEADVYVDAVDVSRRHALVTVTGERAAVEDLGSKNGTVLNGSPVVRPTPLHHLDVIVLGTVRLIVHARPMNAETESVTP